MTRTVRSFKKKQKVILGKKKTKEKLGHAQWKTAANKRKFGELRTQKEEAAKKAKKEAAKKA